MDEAKISIAGKEYTVLRSRLRKWFELERIRENLREAAERGDILSVAELVCSYLSAASSNLKEIFENAPWYEAAAALSKIELMNYPNIEFPMFRDTVSKKKEEDEIPWDYENRTWYSWVHILGSAFGWTLEYISELEIEDGVALVQECLVRDQLEKEWQYSLSEIAYPYNASTKKQEFKALPRPNWMGK